MKTENDSTWPKPPCSAAATTSKHADNQEPTEYDDTDEDLDEDEEFPKSLESLLTKQWNLGMELIKEKCPAKSESSFDIIKLLNLLAECKRENRELEAKLVKLEEKKTHLESLNSKLAVKFVFDESAPTSAKKDSIASESPPPLNNSVAATVDYACSMNSSTQELNKHYVHSAAAAVAAAPVLSQQTSFMSHKSQYVSAPQPPRPSSSQPLYPTTLHTSNNVNGPFGEQF